MKVLVIGLVCLGSLAFVGCDEEAPPGNSSRRAVVPAADVTGHWEMDVEGFVNANWKLFAEGPRKVAEAARKERARLAELGVAERAAAEQRLQDKMDKLPADQREMVEAVLGTPDQLKAAILKLVRQRMANDCVTLDFHTGGKCTFVLAIPGQERQDAEGTWSQKGDSVTVTLTSANGKPPKGRDLEPATMTIRGDRLSFVPKPGAPTIVVRRA